MNLCIIFTGKILLLLIITTTSSVDSLLFNRFKGKSIDQLIYNRFESTKSDISFCIRRFNLTHSTGCSSKQDGNNGHPYQIFNHLDMETKVLIERYKKYGPLILIINIQDFYSIDKLRQYRYQLIKWITGVILIEISDQSSMNSSSSYRSYSQESHCPNIGYGIQLKKHYGNKTHTNNDNDDEQKCSPEIPEPNPYENYSKISWPFPFFFVRNKTAIKEFQKCQQKSNCRLQLLSFMYGTINSQRCLKRSQNAMDMVESSYCKLIRARNLLASLFPVYENQSIYENRSILLLTARLDSFTMFDSYSPGADSVYSAFIVMIAIISTLNKNQHLLQTNRTGNQIKNILYAFFDGESFGHIGSNSWIFYNNFMDDPSAYGSILTSKIKLKSIKQVIELNQLIGDSQQQQSGQQYWIHSDDSMNDNNEPTIAEKFLKFCKRNKFLMANNRPLPSSSTAKQFRRYDTEIDALLLAGYGSEIRNPYFHSLFDSGHYYNLDIIVERLTKISDLVVNFLFEILAEQEYSKYQLKTDRNLIHQLVDCLIGLSSICDLFDSNLKLFDVQFEFTAPIQRETDMMMNTIETRSTHIKQRIQFNIDVRRSLQIILFYANSRLKNCSSISSTIMDENGFTVIPLGYNQTYFDGDYHSNDYRYSQCLLSQTVMEVTESTYAEYIGKGLLLLADDQEMLRQQMNHLMMTTSVDFSTWTESNYHKNFAYRPVIRIFFEQSFWLKILSFFLGSLFTSFSIWLIKLIEENSEYFFNQQQQSNNDGRSYITTVVGGSTGNTTTTTTATVTNKSNEFRTLSSTMSSVKCEKHHIQKLMNLHNNHDDDDE